MLEGGASFGKYRILRQLGRGATGVVYLAQDQVLGRQVALKILDRSVMSGDRFEQRFQQEARAVARLDHPNVIQIHDLERIGEDWAIDMAYAEGGSLADAAASGALTIQEALSFVRDVLGALAACHEVGVIHRDVKPNNILISSDGRALLSDFGLAAILAEHHRTAVASASSSGLFVGTPRYAPPESWNEQEPTPAWDVYSVGMVIFELVAGKTPYDAGSPFALMRQMIEHPVPRLVDIAPSVTPGLSELVGAMLDQDPGKRPENAREALNRLEQLPEIEADAAREAPTLLRQRVRLQTARSPSFLRRRRRKRLRFAAWGMAAAISTVLILAGAVLWRPWGSSSDPVGRFAQRTARLPGTGSSQAAVFTSIDTSTHQVRSNHLLMLSGKKPDEWILLGGETTHLWYVLGHVDNDVYWDFRGYWGEYTDDTARYFQHGQVAGKGRWIEPGREMTISLQFQTVDLGTRRSQTLVLKRSESPMSEADFVREVQENDCLLPLLYNELFPRRLPWAEDVETRFLVLASQRTIVPFLGLSPPPIRVDGRLDEPAWRTIGTDSASEPGFLIGRPKTAHGSLRTRWDADALFLGMEMARSVARPRIVIVLLHHYTIPVAQSERWSVRVDENAVITGRHTRRGSREPWDCAWEVMASSADGWQAEIRVPFKDLGVKETPEEGARWRLNAALYDLDTSEDIPIALWGAEDLNAAEQGVILVLLRE